MGCRLGIYPKTFIYPELLPGLVLAGINRRALWYHLCYGWAGPVFKINQMSHWIGLSSGAVFENMPLNLKNCMLPRSVLNGNFSSRSGEPKGLFYHGRHLKISKMVVKKEKQPILPA